MNVSGFEGVPTRGIRLIAGFRKEKIQGQPPARPGVGYVSVQFGAGHRNALLVSVPSGPGHGFKGVLIQSSLPFFGAGLAGDLQFARYPRITQTNTKSAPLVAQECMKILQVARKIQSGLLSHCMLSKAHSKLPAITVDVVSSRAVTAAIQRASCNVFSLPVIRKRRTFEWFPDTHRRIQQVAGAENGLSRVGRLPDQVKSCEESRVGHQAIYVILSPGKTSQGQSQLR